MTDKTTEESIELPVQIIRIRETQKTIRWGIVGSTIVIGLMIVAWTVTTLKSEKGWIVIIISTLLTPSIPALVAWRFWLRVRQFTRDTTGRTRQLELEFDAQRSSSRLNEDGTTPESFK